jgi:flavin-dependent dehydrogenase
MHNHIALLSRRRKYTGAESHHIVWYLCPVYAPAPRSFFVFNQRLVCVVRAAAEKAGEECWPVFSADGSEIERDGKKIGYKKG